MRAAARLILAGFCWMTAAYAFVASSAFAYLQFVRPRVFPWVGQFSDWHPLASLMWLAILIAFAWRDLRARGRGWTRLTAFGGLAITGALCVFDVMYSVIAGLSSGSRSIAVGVLSLLPLMWLAVLDHVREAPYVRSQKVRKDESQLRAFESRLLRAALASGGLLSLLYAGLTSFGLAGKFEPDLMMSGLAVGFAASLAEHLALFVAAFLLVALIVRATARRFILQYAVIAIAFVALIAGAFDRVVGRSLSLHGASGWIAALATALSVVGAWTSARLAGLASRKAPVDSALDLFIGRAASCAGRLAGPSRFVAVALLAFAAIAVSERADWDFTILRVAVLAVWLCAFSVMHQTLRSGESLSTWAVAVICLVPLVGTAAAGTNGQWRRALDRYAAHNPSFQTADWLLRGSASRQAAFDNYLQAHTGLTDVQVSPVGIDFVPRLAPAAGERPLLFLFVIDSLRPDYLSPYNPSVRFTPKVAEFASESTVFANAFTAFGGTGLSVPAMWAGASLVHKQYVKPFHPMNALEKLLDANGYLRIVGLDSIMSQLLEPSPKLDELDRGRSNEDYEFCTTLEELGTKLGAVGASTPVFAYLLPQDVHMARLPRTVESGEAFRDFYAPYATKVHAVDACFGRFVARLKALGLYERSLVVLTSDHGEMLGEDGRFGHSYHLFPQIVRVPLIVHFPSWIDRRSIDAGAVSRTVDITPTMYAALGYRTSRPSVLMGRPLIGVDEDQSTARRRATYVIAASYGAVYATLRHNGRRLYIADAIRGGDQAFERAPDGRWAQSEIPDGLRAVNQLAIRQYLDEIARTYQLGERP